MDKDYCFKIGRYFEFIQEYDDMLHYYHKGVQYLDNRAMYSLGCYYQKIEDFDNMIKYYTMAIEYKSDFAMNYLGNYFGKQSKYDLFKKYHLMAIKLGNLDSMNELAFYYQVKEKNYNLMKKYYLMGAKLNYAPCICNLGRYYQSINDKRKTVLLYKLAIKHNSKLASKNLEKYKNCKKDINDLCNYYSINDSEMNTILDQIENDIIKTEDNILDCLNQNDIEIKYTDIEYINNNTF